MHAAVSNPGPSPTRASAVRWLLVLVAFAAAPAAWGHGAASRPAAGVLVHSSATCPAGADPAGAVSAVLAVPGGDCERGASDDHCCGHCSVEVADNPLPAVRQTPRALARYGPAERVLRARPRYHHPIPRGPPLSV